MGMRIEKMRAEWPAVKEHALVSNFNALLDSPWRAHHHALDVFTESFRHGPYWSSHVYVPWVIYLLIVASVGWYRIGAGDVWGGVEVILWSWAVPFIAIGLAWAGYKIKDRFA